MEAAEALGFLLFASGKQQEQVAVCLGPESFRTVAIVMKKRRGKGPRGMLVVLGFEFVECGQGIALYQMPVVSGIGA